MTPQPYNPATIGFIRKEAENGRGILALADMLGWTVTRLRSVCRHHQVTFSDGPPLPDAKPDVGRLPRRPDNNNINRFSRDETITVRVSSHLGELLRRKADFEGVPLSRYCGNIIAKMFGDEQPEPGQSALERRA